MHILLIDDMKDPVRDPIFKEIGPVSRIARNYQDGIAALTEVHWDRLLLDHDLADFTGPGGSERDGMSVICWLARPANRQHIPGEIICVSRNSVGIPQMIDAIAKLYSDPDQVLMLDAEYLRSWYEG